MPNQSLALILSLALGITKDILSATDHPDAARNVGYLKSTVDLVVAGGDLRHALQHVPEGGELPGVGAPRAESPRGLWPREPVDVPRAIEPISSVPVVADGTKRVLGGPEPPRLLPLH